MKTTRKDKKNGFTLIEILTVIAIIGILAAILVPVAGKARETALRRRAAAEMNSIKVAVLQFQADHRYMPWGDPENKTEARVGADVWTTEVSNHELLMRWLTGENPLKKNYLQIPEKSRPEDKSLVFVDPWMKPYMIGLDRNLDGAVTVVGSNVSSWDNKTVMERVLVYSKGDPETDPLKKLKTFDVP